MVIQFLPYLIEICFKLRGTAGGERCAVGKFEINGDDTFDRRRPFSEDDNGICHTDRFRDVMRYEDCGLFLLFDDFAYVISDVQTSLVIEGGEWFIQQQQGQVRVPAYVSEQPAGAFRRTAAKVLRFKESRPYVCIRLSI